MKESNSKRNKSEESERNTNFTQSLVIFSSFFSQNIPLSQDTSKMLSSSYNNVNKQILHANTTQVSH